MLIFLQKLGPAVSTSVVQPKSPRAIKPKKWTPYLAPFGSKSLVRIIYQTSVPVLSALLFNSILMYAVTLLSPKDIE